MNKRGDISIFKNSIVSTNISCNNYLDDDPTGTTKSVRNSDTPSENSETEEDLFETLANTIQYEIYLDEFMESATQAKLWKNTSD